MKIFTGKVVSTKMAKTAVVVVERMVVHPMYLKRYKRNKKYLVHDEKGVKVGDMVKFSASKPFSKLKKWQILSDSKKEIEPIVKKASPKKEIKTKRGTKK